MYQSGTNTLMLGHRGQIITSQHGKILTSKAGKCTVTIERHMQVYMAHIDTIIVVCHPSNVLGVSANQEETVTVDGAYGMHAHIHETSVSRHCI